MKKTFLSMSIAVFFFSCSNEIIEDDGHSTTETKNFNSCCCEPTNLKLSADYSRMLQISWKDVHTDNIYKPPHANEGYIPLYQYNIDKDNNKVEIVSDGGAIRQVIQQTGSPCTGYYAMEQGKTYDVTVTCSHGKSINSYYHMSTGGQDQDPCAYKYPQISGNIIYNHSSDNNDYCHILFNINVYSYDEHPNSGRTYRVFAYRGNKYSNMGLGDYFYDDYMELDKDSGFQFRVPYHRTDEASLEPFVRLEIRNSGCEIYSRHYLEIKVPVSSGSGDFIGENKFTNN